jgi:hypothetical protein
MRNVVLLDRFGVERSPLNFHVPEKSGSGCGQSSPGARSNIGAILKNDRLLIMECLGYLWPDLGFALEL